MIRLNIVPLNAVYVSFLIMQNVEFAIHIKPFKEITSLGLSQNTAIGAIEKK